MRQCRGCGVELTKRSQKIYCGNTCQASARRKTSTELWLASGGARIDSHQGHYIREYLLDAQSGCCAVCGAAAMWLGLPLAFVLDHIDGDPTTTRRTTRGRSAATGTSRRATYKSRSRGKGRYCRRPGSADGRSF